MFYGVSCFVSIGHLTKQDNYLWAEESLKDTAEQNWPADSHLRTHGDKVSSETSNLLYIWTSEPPTAEMTKSQMGNKWL